MADAAEAMVRQTTHDAVLVVELNRPDSMNALTPGMVEQLHEALQAGDADDGVRAIVLTGAGRAFSTGFDLARKPAEPSTVEELVSDWYLRDKQGVANLFSIMEMSTPVIAAVNGWCMGGGFWYALACDITIAGQSAVFAQPEVRHVSNSTFLFAVLAGYKNAHRYTLTGDHFDASEALRIGIVSEVVPDEELMDRSLALAGRLALVPRVSVRMNKAITNLGLQAAGLRAGMALNAALSTIAHSSMDAEEVRELIEARRDEDMKRFLHLRDDPFRPEPGGPRSRK